MSELNASAGGPAHKSEHTGRKDGNGSGESVSVAETEIPRETRDDRGRRDDQLWTRLMPRPMITRDATAGSVKKTGV